MEPNWKASFIGDALSDVQYSMDEVVPCHLGFQISTFQVIFLRIFGRNLLNWSQEFLLQAPLKRERPFLVQDCL